MRKLVGMTLLLIALVAAICFYQVLTFGGVAFFRPENLSNLAQRVGILGIYAIGAGIVIISGGIDLSIGSVIGFVGVIMAMTVSTFGLNPWVVALGCLILGVGLGLWHGFLIGRFNLQPFVVTLCTLLLLRGLARGISGGISQKLDGFSTLGNSSILHVPIPFWILIAVALVVGFFMNFTVYGRYLYAIGRNAEAVRYSGVNVNRMRTAAYVACAVLSAVAGIVSVSYTGEVQPASAGLMFEMWAIAAAVLGGCSLRGGEGSVIGIIIGAALIKVMYNGINLLGISTEWEWAVIGVVILGGVIADAAYRQRSERKTS
ncbi:MAG: ABC transporter permease [Armatimonadota bacterium]|nr:ABC transporter permease [Armatimonadota bacterium]